MLALLCGAIPLWAADTTAASVPSGKRQAGGDELARARAAHRARPSDPEIAMKLGLLLYRQNRLSLEAQRLLNVASRRFPQRHDVHLALLDSFLARKDSAAATALLARLERELDSSARFAFDTTYCLLQHEQLALAQAQWQRVDERVQSSASGRRELDPVGTLTNDGSGRAPQPSSPAPRRSGFSGPLASSSITSAIRLLDASSQHSASPIIGMAAVAGGMNPLCLAVAAAAHCG